MKKENTASRLKSLMNERGLRQVDILNACQPYCQEFAVKMNKSDISQYLSGKAEPNQDKLFILASALRVSVAWLMGYDAPTSRSETLIPFPKPRPITAEHNKLLRIYDELNSRGRDKLFDTAVDMSFNPLYNDDYQQVIAAHARTDIEITDEMMKHDKDIMNDDSEWE